MEPLRAATPTPGQDAARVPEAATRRPGAPLRSGPPDPPARGQPDTRGAPAAGRGRPGDVAPLPHRGIALAAILLGGLLLVWPAWLNGYPLLFSDSGAFLHQTLGPLMIWDKPWIYGPLLHLFHARVTLWGPVLAQGLALSHLLWLCQRAVTDAAAGRGAGAAAPLATAPASIAPLPAVPSAAAPPPAAPSATARPPAVPPPAPPSATAPSATVPSAGASLAGTAAAARHLLVVAALAGLTTAPWAAALLMPDILAPVVLLGLFLLGFARRSLSRREAAWVAVLTTLAIAAHLSHLPLAAALLALTLLLARRRRPALRVAAPLLAACGLLLLSNAVGHGRASLSPHGATFLLARLVANGPAARTVAARCPRAGWYLCDWAGRLPGDSDVFLWDPDSPVNRDAAGRPRFLGGALLSPEAREIVAETLAREPGAVALDALRDSARQLVTAGIGDTLSREALGEGVRLRIAEGFPARELAAFDAAAQARGALPGLAAPWLAPHAPVLLAAALLLPWLWWRERRAPVRLAFVLCVLVGVSANAVATGALSKPHHRYGARIAWLVPGAALLLVLPRRRWA